MSHQTHAEKRHTSPQVPLDLLGRPWGRRPRSFRIVRPSGLSPKQSHLLVHGTWIPAGITGNGMLPWSRARGADPEPPNAEAPRAVQRKRTTVPPQLAWPASPLGPARALGRAFEALLGSRTAPAGPTSPSTREHGHEERPRRRENGAPRSCVCAAPPSGGRAHLSHAPDGRPPSH